MQLRKIFAIVLVAIMMFSLTAFAIAAEGETPAEGAKMQLSSSLKGETNVVKPGDEISVEISIKNNAGLGSIKLEIPYDSTKLEYKGTANGTVFSESATWDGSFKVEDGVIILQYLELSGVASKDGVIATLTFKVLVDGDFELPVVEYVSAQEADGTINKIDKFEITSPDEPIKAHDYKAETVPATCTTDAKTVYTCACGDVYEVVDEGTATGHSFGEWTVVKNPTEKEEGLEERKCACGETETKAIEKIPTSPEDENTTTVVIIIVVAVVVIGAVATIIVLKKKELI